LAYQAEDAKAFKSMEKKCSEILIEISNTMGFQILKILVYLDLSCAFTLVN